MRIVLTLLAYVVALAVVTAICFVAVMFLAGPHAGLLPAPMESAVLILGWILVLVLPALVARRVWRRRAPASREPVDAALMRDVARLTAGLAVPAAHLVRSDTWTGSYLGGYPSLPRGCDWPQWRGRKLDLVACLSLSGLHAATPIDWLPRTGSLLIFYDAATQPWGFDPADRGCCVVLHVPGPERNAAPDGDDNAELFDRIDVAFRAITSRPSQERDVMSHLSFTDEESDAYEALREAPYDEAPKHQVGGYPFPVQGDGMELEVQLASNGLYCGDASGFRDPRAQSLMAGASDWRLLLQLDSDDDAGVMWGDCGTLYVWVRAQDASRGRFDEPWLILQCS